MRARRANTGPGHAGHPTMDLAWRTRRVCGQSAPTRVGAPRHRRAAEHPRPPGGTRRRRQTESSVLATRHPTWRTRQLAARFRPDTPHGRPAGSGAWPDGHRLNHDALDLVDGDRVRRPVVELRRLRGGVPGDLLRVFERPAIRQIRCDPRRPERVAAGRGREICRLRPPRQAAPRRRAPRTARSRSSAPGRARRAARRRPARR